MNDTTLNLDDSGGEGSRRRRPTNCQSRKLICSALFVCAIGVSVVAALVASRNGSRRGNEPMIFLKGKKSREETLGRRLKKDEDGAAEKEERALLGECEGDCDRDKDCKGSLVCYQRGGEETVPGCPGPGISGKDYCSDRPDNYLLFVGWNPKRKFPLGLCKGDCDSDDECADDLVCEKRDGYEPVPGCDGMGRRDADYCRIPDMIPANALIIIKGSDGTLLGECEGDCDSDRDCEDSLVCYKRAGDEILPGCSGRGVYKKDYCIDRPDNYLLFRGKNPRDPLGLCEGDCDSNDDCADDLVCQERNGFDSVPGCDGRGRRHTDYCRIPVWSTLNPIVEVPCGEGEVCKANYCGGCHAMCEPVTNSPAATNGCNRENQCSDPRGGCADLVQCLINPCDVEGAKVVTPELI